MADSFQITYDLSTQVPPSELDGLRSQILLLLQRYASGPKPIRVQLSVCLAILAIQMKEWNDVLPSVVSSLSSSPESHAAILDFLRVLPEEVTEGRKITLSVRGTRKPATVAPMLSEPPEVDRCRQEPHMSNTRTRKRTWRSGRKSC